MLIYEKELKIFYTLWNSFEWKNFDRMQYVLPGIFHMHSLNKFTLFYIVNIVQEKSCSLLWEFLGKIAVKFERWPKVFNFFLDKVLIFRIFH